MSKFQEVLKENIDKLILYVPVVDRVHSPEHPEFKKVHEDFKLMVEKLEADPAADLADVFASFRETTDNYTVPADTCESYEAVYQMLELLDQAYSN